MRSLRSSGSAGGVVRPSTGRPYPGSNQPADANARTVNCPPGFLGGKKIKAGRYTFSTHDTYKAQSLLVPSGLIGPVALMTGLGSM